MRGRKIMLDFHLAALYQVSTKAFNQAVRRNLSRFPPDFMFQLTPPEAEILRSQSVTSSWGGRRYLPYAFTEQGVAMLASVLKSQRAIQVNIMVVRAFVRLREMIAASKDIAARVEKLEASQRQTASVIEVLVEDIDGIARQVKEMKNLPPASRRRIGFRR
jgi:hypothetical protein